VQKIKSARAIQFSAQVGVSIGFEVVSEDTDNGGDTDNGVGH